MKILQTELLPQHLIENKILFIRGKKVMLDRDLAMLYGVDTAQLKRQVKRNIERFPSDFVFVLNQDEIDILVCHFGIPSKSYFGGASPYAFTEHGILMLSSVLKSKRAIKVNIQIMRTFTKLREILASHKELRHKIKEMEKKYDSQFKVVFDAIRQLMTPPESKPKQIGFLPRKK
jgi:phage regulator Rha-like protein